MQTRWDRLETVLMILVAGLAAWRPLSGQEIVRVADLNPGPAGGGPSYLTVFQDALYFRANDLPSGSDTELWRYDGVQAERVADIKPGPEGSNPSYLKVFGDRLYFSAMGPAGPPRLYQCDGRQVFLAPGGDSQAQNPEELFVLGTNLFFRAFRSNVGIELWRFDGTRQVLIDLFQNGNPSNNGSSLPQHFVVYNGLLHFSGNALLGQGAEIWSLNAAATSASRVTNIYPDNGSSPSELTVWNGSLYFAARDGTHGNELWRLNAQGSVLVADIAPGGPYDSGNPSSITVYRNALYFCADNGVDGAELWRYDGAVAEMVTNINPHPQVPDIDPIHHSWPGDLFVFHDVLYFSADDGIHGRELWSYDGTRARLVADIWPGPNGSDVTSFVVYRDTLHFSANDGQVGGELGTLREGVFAMALIPRVDLTSSEDRVTISWPAWAESYRLEECFQLPAQEWRPFTETPRRAGDRWEVMLTPAGPAHFFRLHQP